ncbi:transposase [Pseudomonas soli]
MEFFSNRSSCETNHNAEKSKFRRHTDTGIWHLSQPVVDYLYRPQPAYYAGLDRSSVRRTANCH